jgi:glycerol-3-phosphate dehydrogenase (NAD+)
LLGSCGVADLIATCYGGRNRKCAAEFAKQRLHSSSSTTEEIHALWHHIEQELLNGQKLQGVSTCEEVMRFLEQIRYLDEHPDAFPLMRRIHAIACHGQPVLSLLPRAAESDHHFNIRYL